MKVVVVLEFPDITDPNSAEATEVVDALTLDTLRMQEEWADKSARVWVETFEGGDVMKEETYVWFVLGDEEFGDQPALFDTKMAAEKWARVLFPEEHPDKRYGRVYARLVWTMDEI